MPGLRTRIDPEPDAMFRVPHDAEVNAGGLYFPSR